MRTRLKEIRMEKGLSQVALATRLEMNQSTISKIETGDLIPDADILCRYSAFFHVSVDYLLFQSEEKIKADDLLLFNPSLVVNQKMMLALKNMSRYQNLKLSEFLDSMRI